MTGASLSCCWGPFCYHEKAWARLLENKRPDGQRPDHPVVPVVQTYELCRLKPPSPSRSGIIELDMWMAAADSTSVHSGGQSRWESVSEHLWAPPDKQILCQPTEAWKLINVGHLKPLMLKWILNKSWIIGSNQKKRRILYVQRCSFNIIYSNKLKAI